METKEKSLGSESGVYVTCVRTSHRNDLIFAGVSWAVATENIGEYIFNDV